MRGAVDLRSGAPPQAGCCGQDTQLGRGAAGVLGHGGCGTARARRAMQARLTRGCRRAIWPRGAPLKSRRVSSREGDGQVGLVLVQDVDPLERGQMAWRYRA